MKRTHHLQNTHHHPTSSRLLKKDISESSKCLTRLSIRVKALCGDVELDPQVFITEVSKAEKNFRAVLERLEAKVSSYV